MESASDWDRDAFTRGNCSTASGNLESRSDSPQNTKVGLLFALGEYLAILVRARSRCASFNPVAECGFGYAKRTSNRPNRHRWVWIIGQ